jgi:hypothetical protein
MLPDHSECHKCRVPDNRLLYQRDIEATLRLALRFRKICNAVFLTKELGGRAGSSDQKQDGMVALGCSRRNKGRFRFTLFLVFICSVLQFRLLSFRITGALKLIIRGRMGTAF